MKRLIALCLLCALLLPAAAQAQSAEPELQDALVWVVNAWDGKVYQTTFAPPASRTIFLMAGQPATLRLTHTKIYYWPITREYRADWLTMDRTFQGTLQVWDGARMVQKLEYDTYLIQSPTGDWQENTVLYTGEKAKQQFQAYQDEQDRYTEQARAYFEKMRNLKEGDEPPQPPRPPRTQTTDPTPAFVIDLPPGRYTLRVHTPEGSPIPEADRELVVFSARREGVGYLVIPEERWTAPETAASPGHVIYATGERTVYLVPHWSIEVPEWEYERLLNPQARTGRRDQWRWVLTRPLDGEPLSLALGGRDEQVTYARYHVEQLPGSTLGYRVIPAQPGRATHFGGYRIDLRPGFGQATVHLGGDPTSVRLIQEIASTASLRLLEVLAALIALGGTALFFWRRYRLPTA